MKPVIKLQTKDGYKFYNEIRNKFLLAKMGGRLAEYKTDLFKERTEAEREVLNFLNDDLTESNKMDDNDDPGWVTYKRVSDKYSVLNYFYNRRA